MFWDKNAEVRKGKLLDESWLRLIKRLRKHVLNEFLYFVFWGISVRLFVVEYYLTIKNVML